MTRNNTITLVLIIILFGFSLWAIIPLLSSVDLVYQPAWSANTTAQQKQMAIDDTIATIDGRLASFSNVTVKPYGTEGIIVNLGETSDQTAAVKAIGTVSPPVRTIEDSEYYTVIGMLEDLGIDDGYVQEPEPDSPWLPDFERDNPFPDEYSRVVWHWKHGFTRS